MLSALPEGPGESRSRGAEAVEKAVLRCAASEVDPSKAMPRFRSLLLALFLPALLLPDGMTLCLRRLVGDLTVDAERDAGCCVRCCAKSPIDPATARLRDAEVCVDCCVHVPPTGRSLEPTSRKCSDVATPLLAISPPPFAPAPRAAPTRFALDASGRGPPLAAAVPITLPLRL
jgi:hypothetical protein